MSDTDNITLASSGNWDDDFSDKKKNTQSQSDRPKTEYLVTNKGVEKDGYIECNFKFRPVGGHIKCRKLFKPYKATLQDSDKDSDPAWSAGWYPSKRFAINIIDRADGKLKILEKGSNVFKKFAEYKALFSKDPAGNKEGVDFIMKVKIPIKNGKPDSMNTEYLVSHVLPETPLTAAEQEMIKTQKLWPLKQIYKSTPIEQRQKMWDELSEAAKEAPPSPFDKEGGKSKSGAKQAPKAEVKEEVKPEPIQDKMENSPADDDDLFADTSDDKSEGANAF
jgi:hypothetical protein